MVRKTVVLPSIKIIQTFETSRWLSTDTLPVVSGKTVTIEIQKSTVRLFCRCFSTALSKICKTFVFRTISRVRFYAAGPLVYRAIFSTRFIIMFSSKRFTPKNTNEKPRFYLFNAVSVDRPFEIAAV